jgi:hypothetical protein
VPAGQDRLLLRPLVHRSPAPFHCPLQPAIGIPTHKGILSSAATACCRCVASATASMQWRSARRSRRSAGRTRSSWVLGARAACLDPGAKALTLAWLDPGAPGGRPQPYGGPGRVRAGQLQRGLRDRPIRRLPSRGPLAPAPRQGDPAAPVRPSTAVSTQWRRRTAASRKGPAARGRSVAAASAHAAFFAPSAHAAFFAVFLHAYDCGRACRRTARPLSGAAVCRPAAPLPLRRASRLRPAPRESARPRLGPTSP